MIAAVRLLYRLHEETARKIMDRFWPEAGGLKHTAGFPGKAVWQLELFQIRYQELGLLWFLHVWIDFPLLGCLPGETAARLEAQYEELLGKGLAAELPGYDACCCDYIEYTAVREVSNASAVLWQMGRTTCVPEQLDRALWQQYQKPHGTVAFCAAKRGEQQLELYARCHGTALKRIVRDETLHYGVGLLPKAAVSEKLAAAVLEKQEKKYLPSI